jgi:hypothetical protein
MKVGAYFTCAIGNEVTTETGHFIAFPAPSTSAALPDFNLSDWPALMASIRAVPGLRIVVLNHPRDVHSKFIPFDPANFNAVTGENLRGAELTFDAMEAVNSGALQSDFMRMYRDWFALLNHGYRIAAVGASDSHDVSRSIVGQGRSYLVCDDRAPGKIDVAAACRSIQEGRVAVSLGLLTHLTVDRKFRPGDLAPAGAGEIEVEVKVHGPGWTEADRVDLYANGARVREAAIPPAQGAVEKAVLKWTLPRPAHDLHLVAIASGPGVTAPYWPIPSPYQPTDGVRAPRVIGSTGPVWIDADGDGQFTSARAYARRIVERAGSRPDALLPALAGYDEAVAAQAASLCRAAGEDIDAPAFAAVLKSAPEPVRKGFAAYSAALPTPAR